MSGDAGFKSEIAHAQSIPAVGRNEPCPCGSGRRYKDCHGTLGELAPAPDASRERLNNGALRLRAGDIDGAEGRAREVLSAQPGNARALHLAAFCDYERGRIDDALRGFLAAAKAWPAPVRGRADRPRIWSDLNFAFTLALSGVDGAIAATRRSEYAQWLAALPGSNRAEMPSVSAVLVVTGPARWLERSLASLAGQTYPRLDLIVVDGTAGEVTRRLNELLSTCRLPHRLLLRPGMDEAGLINEGVRASTGEYLNVLRVDDEFAPERVASLIEHLAMRGMTWGFSGVDFIDAAGDVVPDDEPGRDVLNRIAESDTIGYALINREHLAIAIGSLFFSRAVFERVGGMRALQHTYAWDFCLRVLWHEEPLYLPAKLYRHRTALTPEAAVFAGAGSEAEQLLREFYARASEEQESAPNRFAPCVRHWGMHFFKAPFDVGDVLMFSLERLEAIAEAIRLNRGAPTVAELSPGVNLIGYAFGEFGQGESLRALARACALGGIPFIVKDVGAGDRTRKTDQSVAAHIADKLQHRCSLVCVNPDEMKHLLPLGAATSAAGGSVVGYWYWELEQFPREWAYALETVDEIWVATDFVAGAVRGSTAKQVIKIPPPIEVRLSHAYTRSDFGLPEDRFLLLFSFDFNSYVERKNPAGVMAAFKRAFGRGRRDVALVIKSINGRHQPERMRALRDLIDGDERIIIKDGYLTRDQVYGLESVVDAFVSLHRSEGFGLGLAESMYLGKPVIGTAYSGNLEFMNHENSCLVDYELIAVRKGDYLYDDERFRWADPDIEHAAHYMSRLVGDAVFRNSIASRGQRDVRSGFTPATTATLMRRRLLELGLI